MNFKQSTDALLKPVTLEDLATAMGVSVQTVRQARAAESTTAHRPPPNGWPAAVALLAEERVSHYNRLLKNLRGSRPQSGRS